VHQCWLLWIFSYLFRHKRQPFCGPYSRGQFFQWGITSGTRPPFTAGANCSQKKHGPICRARCHPRFVGVFVLGGKDVNLELWRSPSEEHLTAIELEWFAKNVANDEYNLKQPVWISDLCFLDDECRPPSEGYTIACCTRFHQVLLVFWTSLTSHRSEFTIP
jgi:hypothetical protein